MFRCDIGFGSSWANVALDLCRYIASLGHNEFLLVLRTDRAQGKASFSNISYEQMGFCVIWSMGRYNDSH